MDKIVIQGGKRLNGEIAVSGSKNAALPTLISSLLTAEPCSYRSVPHLADIRTTLKLLGGLGGRGEHQRWRAGADDLTLQADRIDNFEAPYDLVKTMRASFLVIGPLVARFGRARVFYTGRLCHRRAPHRLAFERPRSTRRDHRTDPWLCRSPGGEIARREDLSRLTVGWRHRKSHDGGDLR